MNIIELFGLEGKTAIITGGAGYLGRAMSEGLAAAGANIVIASRNKNRCQELAEILTEKHNVRAIGIALDISSMDITRDVMKEVVRQMGTIDILVNNAVFSRRGSIEAISEQDWLDGIDGTINGVFRCTKAAVPYMKSQKYGVIINI